MHTFEHHLRILPGTRFGRCQCLPILPSLRYLQPKQRQILCMPGSAPLAACGNTSDSNPFSLCSSAGGDSAAPDATDTEVAEGNFDIWVKGRFDQRGYGLPTMRSSLLLFAG